MHALIRAIAAWCAVASLAGWLRATPEVVITPDAPDASYSIGQTIGWSLRAAPDSKPARYVVRANGGAELARGDLVWDDGRARVGLDAALAKPGMLLLELLPAQGNEPIARAGAAVEPEAILPDTPEPADFDAFWNEKLAALRALPPAPKLMTGPSDHEGVDYATLTLENLRGAKVHAQLARPAREGKFPALLILQWAGGPYPLQKSWVTDRAAEGWLALNVMPHDLPHDLPKEFYEALPKLLKDYQTIGDTDRERSYFLGMILGACRAADYLATRPDWDGRVLVASGPSMGGMQALAVAALEPRVTHLIAHTPAGCDALAARQGRAAGYPFWNIADERVAGTAPYFDAVNFAARVRVPSLVSMGYIDTTTPPAGIWMAFNRIAGPKEAVPMPEAPHGHLAKPGQEKPFNDRRDAWLRALAKGEAPEPRPAGS